VFDLSITKLLVLGVIALVVFGPNELPKIASQAGRALRDLRRIAEGAKADLKEGLGPEFQDFDFEDLNPRRFVQKHLFDDAELESMTSGMRDAFNGTTSNGSGASVNGAGRGGGTANGASVNGSVNGHVPAAPTSMLAPGEQPPFDAEAT
jgi:sec-independent protein translocase protein TatB